MLRLFETILAIAAVGMAPVIPGCGQQPGRNDAAPVGTLDSARLDSALIDEIGARRAAGAAAGRSSEQIAAELYDVTIEFVGTLTTPEGLGREEAVARMRAQADSAQAQVVAWLRELGVAKFESLLLSNALTATMTAAQINSIAALNDIKIIRLNRPHRVIP